MSAPSQYLIGNVSDLSPPLVLSPPGAEVTSGTDLDSEQGPPLTMARSKSPRRPRTEAQKLRRKQLALSRQVAAQEPAVLTPPSASTSAPVTEPMTAPSLPQIPHDTNPLRIDPSNPRPIPAPGRSVSVTTRTPSRLWLAWVAVLYWWSDVQRWLVRA